MPGIEDRIAVSTWSLHRHLGTTYPHDLTTSAIGPVEETYGEGTESLLDLPSALANRGYRRMELTSLHLPSRDPVYLGELRDQLAVTGVALQTLLVDDGDITHPEHGARDTRWIAEWIDIGAELGAENVRVIAGKQRPGPETLNRSILALRELEEMSAGAVRIVTENWYALLSSPAEVKEVLDRLEDRVGLLMDFGNWSGNGKYAQLAEIAGRAELCHAKASFIDGDLDETDFGRCVDLSETARYAGPYTLIFDSELPVDEWDGLALERDFITARLG